MAPIRIALASPNRDAWSETFIAAHLDRLKDVALVLTHGRLPTAYGDGSPLRPPTLPRRIGDRIQRSLVGRSEDELTRRAITRALKREQVEVLLAEYGNTGEEVLESCRRAGVPLVVHFHGYDAHSTPVLERYGNYRRIFSEAAALVVVSRTMEQHLLRSGAPREKLCYNCYGIDVGRFHNGHPDQAPPHFLSVGRFVAKKAPLITVLAFQKVLQALPDARLTMVGDGPWREACEQVVKAMGLGSAITFAGIRGPDEVATLMQHSRAFVQHSVTGASGDMEGTPLAVLEAMASGIPVVSTRHAGIMDVVAEEERGLLVEEFDLAGMARNMLRVAQEPGTALRMGQAGRAHALQHHRMEDSIAALQRILENAVQR